MFGRGISGKFLYAVNTLFFLLAAALFAVPHVSQLNVFCRMNLASPNLENGLFVKLTCAGAALLVLSIIGCCVARSGKKRYKFSYAIFTLAVSVVCGAAYWWMMGAPLHKKIDNEVDVAGAIHQLQTKAFQGIYNDYLEFYEIGQCQPAQAPLFSCKDCSDMEHLLNTCEKSWAERMGKGDASRVAAGKEFLEKCAAKLDGTDADAKSGFCKCANELNDMSRAYLNWVLLGLMILFLLLSVATCCVSRIDDEAERRAMEAARMEPRDGPGEGLLMVTPSAGHRYA